MWKEGGQKILAIDKAEYTDKVLNIWEDGVKKMHRRV